MASFHPRKRTEWRVVSASQPARNRVFKSGPAEREYACQLLAAGVAAVRPTAHESTAWLVRVCCKGAPNLSKTFDRKADAEARAREREGEIAKRQFVDYRTAERTTLAALLTRYEGEHWSGRDYHHPDRSRARKLATQSFALVR